MNLNIKLTQTQSAFLQDTSLFAQYRGGLGAGKTIILVIWALTRMAMGRWVLLTEPTHQMVRDVLAVEFINMLEQHGIEYTYNKSEQIIDALGGRVYMRSGEAPERMRGINADDFGMDEASSQTQLAFDLGSARAGRRLNDGREQWRLVGTPRGRDWAFHIGEKYDGNVHIQSTFKNPFLSDSYKRNMLEQYTSEFARQELFGEIVDFSAGIIRSRWFRDISDYPILPRSCRSWDLAFTIKKSSDFTASTLLTLDGGELYIQDLFRVKKEWTDVRKILIDTAMDDGTHIPIVIEAVQSQIALIQDLRSDPRLFNHTIIAFTPRGDKLNRAMGWSALAERGCVHVTNRAKKDYFYNECDQFTADDTHEHDDCVDAVSQGYNYLQQNVPGQTGNIRGL